MEAEGEVVCYHKGCGKNYKPEENEKESCRYHPGGPIFHDALKGWSCCKKRSCDFTEFLSIPGCTYGYHSNEKPVLPESSAKSPPPNEQFEEMIIKGPEDNFKEPKHRPSENDMLIPLRASVGASLKTALAKLTESTDEQGPSSGTEGAVPTQVQPGTSCKNNACKGSYVDEMSDTEMCVHHPGVPVFHEGMKFWSCCERRTTEFDKFLEQAGCTSGKHLWIKKEDPGKKVNCRIDWHQTAQFVTISAFAKVAIPEKTVIKSNQVVCDIYIVFEGGKSSFEKKIVLKGVINPEASNVKLLGTKVEINLRKAEPGKWSALEVPQCIKKEEEADGDINTDGVDAL